jgi:hypothetical protein
LSKKIIKKILLIALTFLVFASALFIWKKAIKKESTRQITYDTTSALEKVLQISELYSYKTTYNGVAYVYDKDDSSKISYYVSYNSTVKVGINTEDIKVEADDENKKIIITLPQIMIKEVDVDMSSLDYIFEDKRAETSFVSRDAYLACIDDVNNEINESSEIFELGKQNTETIIRGLVEPLIETDNSGYTLEVVR